MTKCRLEAGLAVQGQHRVCSKRVLSSHYAWNLANKLKTSFQPGSPVVMRGKVFRKAGMQPLNRRSV
jgi:hypothetical protein